MSALISLENGRDAREREPVGVDVADAGLIGNGMSQIGEREALGFEFATIDASGKGDRLIADAGDDVDVLDGQTKDVADLMIVNTLHDCGDEDDLHAGFADIIDRLQLGFVERLPAGALINVVADAVELEIDSLQSGFFRLARKFQVGELDAVRGSLDVREAHFLRKAQCIKPAWMNGRLAAGELNDASSDRLFATKCVEHFADVIKIGLVHVTSNIRVRKADRAGQIAAVSEIDVREAGMRGVHRAQAAIIGAVGRVH